jgi:hypothetical protein
MTNLPQRTTRQTSFLNDNTSSQTYSPPAKLRPPLTFTTTKAPCRVMLNIGNDIPSAVRLEVAGQVMVGRADIVEGHIPGLDLGLYGGQDAGVSRRHAVLFVAENALFVRDLGSTNGTKINGLRLPPNESCKIAEGDQVEFGQLQVKVQLVTMPEESKA